MDFILVVQALASILKIIFTFAFIKTYISCASNKINDSSIKLSVRNLFEVELQKKRGKRNKIKILAKQEKKNISGVTRQQLKKYS